VKSIQLIISFTEWTIGPSASQAHWSIKQGW